MKNLLTYDEIYRFALIASMVGVGFGVGAGTMWYILKGGITDLQNEVAELNKYILEIIKNG